MSKPVSQTVSDFTADRQVAPGDNTTLYEGKEKRPYTRQNSRKKPHFLSDIVKQAQLVNFTQKNLVSRRCTRYAAAYTLQRKSGAKRFRQEEEVPCECGMSYAWHVKHNYVQNGDNHDTPWNINTHGKDTITRDHGIIGFLDTCGEDHDHPRPYVRVKSDTSYEVIYELITEHWAFPAPKLVLLISGSVDISECEQTVSRQLELALSDIIKSTGAWVITDGLGGDVTKCVGNAVRECASVSGQTAYEDFVLLGICPWDSVEGIESLICEEEGGKFPAVYYNVDKATSSYFNQLGTARTLQGAPYKASKNRRKLDGNHTHFIFVDGEEPLKWIREFEKYIASNRTIISNLEMNIPVMRLLIDGGTDARTYDLTYFSPGIPNIIIMLEDCFVDGLISELPISQRNKTNRKSTQRSQSSENTSDSHQASVDNNSSVFPETESPKKVLYVNFRNASTGTALISKLMEAAVEEADHLKISRDYSGSNSSTAFCEDDKSLVKLMLAVVLKQPDYARHNVLTATVDYKALLGDSVYDLFSYFLIHNEYRFVELFIDCGIDLGQFLTLSRINLLYEQVHELNSEDSLVKFVFSLVYRKHENIVVDSWRELKYVGDLLKDLITSEFENEYEVNGENIEQSRQFNYFRAPAEQHLLLWAALFTREQLTKMFWRRGVNHIGTALVVCKLSRKLSRKALKKNMQHVSNTYDNQKRIFEKLAVDVLDECFQQNPRLTRLSLTRRVPSLFGPSPLAIATEAKINSFTEHASCQLEVTRQWNGELSPYTSWIMVTLAAICPPRLFALKFKRRNDCETRDDDEEHFDPGLIRSMPLEVTGMEEKRESDKRTDINNNKVQCCYNYRMSTATWKVFSFFNAPVTKFVYHVISYTIFLIVLSIFVLTELSPYNSTTVITPLEILTWLWLAGLIAEEVQQVISTPGKTRWEKLKKYFGSPWNQMDAIMHLLLVCAIITRFTNVTDYSHTRELYVVAETLFIIRIISISLLTERFGVKVRMILKMLKDVRNFLLILAVFLISFGIAYRSLLYPEAQLNEHLLYNTVFKPYFILFGQIPSAEIVQGQVPGCNSTIHSMIFGVNDACPAQKNWLAGIYMGIYCFVSNIMLINLLIASLGQTFERMQERSEKIWRNDRYILVNEFRSRSWLICPLNILVVSWKFFKFCIKRCKGSATEERGIEIELTERGRRRIELFEKAAAESCWPEELTETYNEEWLIHHRATLICNNDQSGNDDTLTHIAKMESSLDTVKILWKTTPLNTSKNVSDNLAHCRSCIKKNRKK